MPFAVFSSIPRIPKSSGVSTSFMESPLDLFIIANASVPPSIVTTSESPLNLPSLSMLKLVPPFPIRVNRIPLALTVIIFTGAPSFSSPSFFGPIPSAPLPKMTKLPEFFSPSIRKRPSSEITRKSLSPSPFIQAPAFPLVKPVSFAVGTD